MTEINNYKKVNQEDENGKQKKLDSQPFKHKQKKQGYAIFGIAVVVATNILLISSNYIAHRFFLQRWFREQNKNNQIVYGIELDKTGTCLFILIQTFFILQYTCYIRAVFTDPGFMIKLQPPSDFIEESMLSYCKKCGDNKWKPMRAHHCKKCDKCVFRMDHHCFWINNCVGIKNQKFFILFLLYCFVYCLLVIIYLVSSVIILYMKTDKLYLIFVGMTWKYVMCTLQSVICVLFLMMISSYICDQFDVIKTNQTIVESIKELYGKPDTFQNTFVQIFGENKLFWLLPTKPRYNCNYLEVLYTLDHIDDIQQTNSDYLEDHFNNKSHQLYQYFRRYRVL